MKRAEGKILALERALAEGEGERRRLRRELEEEEERLAELPQIEEALKGLQRAEGPDAAAIARAHEEKAARGRERLAFEDLDRRVVRVRTTFAAFATEARSSLGMSVDAALEKGPRGEAFQRARAALQRAAGAMEDAERLVDVALGGAEEEVKTLRLAALGAHAKEDEAYLLLVAKSDADQEESARRADLQQRHDGLIAAKTQHDERRRRYDEVRSAREALLEERRRAYRELFEIRAAIKEQIKGRLAGDDIDVDVLHARNTSAYRDLLADILHGHKVRAELVSLIADGITPANLAAAVRAGDPSRIVAVDKMKSEKAERALKVLDALRESDRLEEIEVVPLGDVVTIALKVGGAYQFSSEVSTGQACTCVLPIVLLNAKGPIFIDQPEDNLDNAFIYDVLVKSIRQVKEFCQIIVVSHNANVPVLADAERVFLLGADGKKGRLVKYGTVDEMRAEIESLLEGGREAFLRRAERYGHGLGEQKP